MTYRSFAGVIIGIKGGFAEVESGGEQFTCRIRGKLRLTEQEIVAGDNVRLIEKGGEHVIEEVLPRRNFLVRPPVANVDLVAIFTPLVSPDVDLMLTDRLCALAERQKLGIVICATKADIAKDDVSVMVEEHYKGTGYSFITLSAPKNEGVGKLKELLKGRISIFAGQSGAGKSTLINAMMPGLGLKTGEVSERIGRGRHTTRQVSLLRLSEGGYVADSPGFSSLELAGVGPDEVRELMPDIYEHEGTCRFKGCRHNAEPGCSVKEAVGSGAISKGRYKHYIALLEECMEAEKRKYD
ncbi:MAG: putative ribosome biogenesis GTPase RsgA [Firmicutes bacterium ADurb.Bin153]|nr:MAG: putative ribosome biogenesis GTPase RsgA [Firmicutes bacterium ADurb.Bin153]